MNFPFYGKLVYFLLIPAYLAGSLFLLNEYKSCWRYTSASSASRLFVKLAITHIPIFILNSILFDRVGLKVSILQLFMSYSFLVSMRLLRRSFFEGDIGITKTAIHDRVLVYGAGVAGWKLINFMNSNSKNSIRVVGFIDDDKMKHDSTINGVKVLGGFESLEHAIVKTGATRFVISSGKIPSHRVKQALELCFNHKVKIQKAKSAVHDVQSSFTPLRNIDLADLIGKKEKPVDLSGLKSYLRGKTVLVTGAGGSIGSELVRQIFALEPQKLLLLDNSEINLFKINQELSKLPSLTEVVPLMIDIAKKDHLDTALKEHMPEVVYHAAAYKHVHLVEINPSHAVVNNILGTKNLLEVCEEMNVEKFLLISTDKAVNPTSIMGKTKRICELLTTQFALRLNKHYSSVRFGNVLGSSGSLIPILYSQIRNGGPLTITDKRMKRYFMSIPEAVKLVLRSSYSSKPGDINILKMGEMIKIVDIAKNLLKLVGKTEDEVPIVYTGAKPGEKLYEELYLSGNELLTDHEDILTLPKGDSGISDNEIFHQKLSGLLSSNLANAEAVNLLNDLIEFNDRTSTRLSDDAIATVDEKVSA